MSRTLEDSPDSQENGGINLWHSHHFCMWSECLCCSTSIYMNPLEQIGQRELFEKWLFLCPSVDAACRAQCLVKQAAHWAHTSQRPLSIRKRLLCALTSTQRVNNLCIILVHLRCPGPHNLSCLLLMWNLSLAEQHWVLKELNALLRWK